jgi:hypothetical protein
MQAGAVKKRRNEEEVCSNGVINHPRNRLKSRILPIRLGTLTPPPPLLQEEREQGRGSRGTKFLPRQSFGLYCPLASKTDTTNIKYFLSVHQNILYPPGRDLARFAFMIKLRMNATLAVAAAAQDPSSPRLSQDIAQREPSNFVVSARSPNLPDAACICMHAGTSIDINTDILHLVLSPSSETK